MPKVTIIRPNEWVNQAQHIYIYINGEKVGEIGINQAMSFDLLAGKHQIELKNRWGGGSKPLTIDLRNKKNNIYEISSNQYTFLITPILFVIANCLYQGAVSILSLTPSVPYDLLGSGLLFLSLFIPFYNRYYMRLKEMEPDAFKKTTRKKQMPLIKNAMECEEKNKTKP